MPGMNRPSDEQKISIATRTLALLNQQADSVRAELLVLREDLGRTQRELSVVPSARLLEANEQLVLAALRAQGIADTARRRLGEVTRAALGAVLPGLSPSGELARTDYRTRVADLLEANEQLMVAAVSSQELEEDAELAHAKQIKFLAMAAHELRNPLLPLRLAAQMLPRAASDAQLLAKLQATINGQLSHMARLIGDLLDGSRISTGKFRLERTAVDLSGVLELAIQTCLPVMEVRRHRFRRVGSSGPLTIHADPVRLVQVFSNLLENAAKYTPEEGLITLDAQVRRRRGDDHHLGQRHRHHRAGAAPHLRPVHAGRARRRAQPGRTGHRPGRGARAGRGAWRHRRGRKCGPGPGQPLRGDAAACCRGHGDT